MRRSLLFAGSLIVDRVKLVDYYPQEGNLTVIRDVVKATGGLAANNPVNLKILDPDLEIGVAGRIGDDDDGKLLLSSLESHGIDCTNILVDPQANTSFTDVMTVKGTGIRTFFHSYGACERFDLADLDLTSIAKSYDYVQMGYHLLLAEFDRPDAECGTVLGKALESLGELNVRTCIDVVSEEGHRLRDVVGATLPHVDDLIINEVEAAGITGIDVRSRCGDLDLDALEKSVIRLFEMGVKQTVVVHAPEGAAGAVRGTPVARCGAYIVNPRSIKGTTGAGDAFCSGVIYGIVNDWDLSASMRLGNAMGAMNLFSPTCTGGAKPLNEVKAFMASHEVRVF